MSSEVSGETQPEVVRYEVDDGVAIITLNRPDRLNAWTPELGDLCFDFMMAATRDPDVGAIVLTGAGRAFCAGADVELLSTVIGSADGPLKGRHEAAETLTVPKPVIAAINGAAVGIGLMFALTCDIRFAAAGAKLGTGYVRMGLPAEDGMSWMLQRLMGQPAALEYLLSGRIMLAEEAMTRGLVTNVYGRDELLPAAVAYARELKQNSSPRAMAMIKRQVYQDADRSFQSALADARTRTMQALALPDFEEGMAAFGEKRKPAFKGISTSVPVDPFWF
jgi:enoyl-CoA hydratase/carnithine racemase